MSNLFLICIFTLVLTFSACKGPDSTNSHSGGLISTKTKDGQWAIVYALDGPRLSYAVVCGPSQEEVLAVPTKTRMGENGKEQVFIYKHDGSVVQIANSGCIFFSCGTNITELKEHITGKTFQAFLDSNPPGYSASDLLRFAGSKPKP